MKRILIIEDDQPYRKVYQRKFEVSGYSVELAADGLEGLEKIHSLHPDAVLLDVMMPKMDGFQVLDAAKSDPKIQHIPIIVITNLATDDDNQKLIQKGADDVIVKSDTEPNEIVERINTLLKQP